MVKRLVFILLILSCLLCLTTCDLVVAIFSFSPFPGYLSQAVASVDMRDEIKSFLGNDYNHLDSDVFVLKNTLNIEYVFVVVRKDAGGQRVYVFDTSLNPITAEDTDYRSNLNLVDLNNDFVVGHIVFSDTLLASDPDNAADAATLPTQDLHFDWDCPAFSRSSGHNYILTIENFGMDLRSNPFDSGWTELSSGQSTIGSPEPLRLIGLGYDWELSDIHLNVSGNPVFLFLHGWDPGMDEGFLEIAWTPAGSYPSLSSDFYTTYYVSPRVYRIRDWNSAYYTRKGVVAETYNRGRYYLLSLDGQIIKEMQITGSDDEVPIDFDIDGEYYYVFDERNFRLYKAVTGF